MRWGWLLPDASYQVLYDGWERQPYRPRHGRTPFVIRGAYSAAMAFSRARERYLGAGEDDFAAGVGVQAPAVTRTAASARTAAGARVVAGAGAGGGAGASALAGTRAAGVSAASLGAAAGRRPRSADLSRNLG